MCGRVLRWVGGVVAGLVLAILAALFLLTNTDRGREAVRGLVVEQVGGAIDGELRVERLEGNLLGAPSLVGVSLADPQGRPFLEAERVTVGFALLPLARRRIVLTGLELENARVVLDDRPGEGWNFERIFSTGAEAEEPPSEGGWGHHVELRDVRLDSVQVTVRMAWEPVDELTEAERAEKVREALAGETLERVVEVPGGLQQVMDFRELRGELPWILVAHPDTADIPVHVATLSGVAEPFRAPPGIVEDLAGELRVGDDALAFSGVRLIMPGSNLSGEAVLGLATGDVVAAVEARPASLADFRFLQPDLPPGVGGEARLGISVREEITQIVAEDLDLDVDGGRVTGELRVDLGRWVSIGDTDLTLDGIGTRFLAEVVPSLELERHGELGGRVAATPVEGPPGPDPANGRPTPVRLDAALRFADEAGGVSHIALDGIVTPDPDEPHLEGLTVRLEPVEVTAIEAVAGELPIAGRFEGAWTFDGSPLGVLQLRGDLAHHDPGAGTSRFDAAGTLDLRDELRFVEMRLGLHEVRLALARDQVEQLPPAATLSGTVRIDGPPAGLLRIDGDLAVADPVAGAGRVEIRGGIAPTDGPAFRDFRVDLDPVPMAVVELVAGELPVDGTLEGTASLDGAPERGLRFAADLIHEGEPGRGADPEAPDADAPEHERSRIAAVGELRTEGDGFVELDATLDSVSLRTVGRFAPDAALRGHVSGRIEALGSLGDLTVRAALELPRDGTLQASARLDLASEIPDYDVDLSLAGADLSELSGRIDEATALSGEMRVEGTGTDPARARARLEADLVDELEGGPPRSLFARMSVAEGLLSADSVGLELENARAGVAGTFGLTPERRGELRYTVEVDSLGVFTPLLPTDEDGVVEPRPAVHEAAVDALRQEVLRDVRERQVEYLATGEMPDPPAARDTVGLVPLRRDVVAGRARASGTVSGHVEDIDVAGDATVEELTAFGHHVGWAAAEYEVVGVGEARTEGALDLRATDLLVSGFGYERVVVEAGYRGEDLRANEAEADEAPSARHRGDVAAVLYQDEHTRIRTAGAFEVSDGAGRVRLDDLTFHVPNATYWLADSAVVRWSEQRVEIDGFRLESGFGAVVAADGSLPRTTAGDAPGAVDLRIADFELEHLMILAQQGEGTTGLLDVDLPVRGTLARPSFEGEVTLRLATVGGRGLPDTRVVFAYADRELSAEALLLAVTGEPMLEAEARLPVDLALVDAEEDRLLDGPIHVDARIDDLALEVLPAFTDQIEMAFGRADGRLSVEGTFDEPRARGDLSLAVPSMYVVPLGVRLGDVAASLRLADEVLHVDSLVARSRGPLRMSGQVELPWRGSPAFDLVVEARNSQVMDTRDVQMRVDADLAIAGPYEAVEITGEVRTRRGVIHIPETEELAAAGPLNLADPTVFERVDPRLVAIRDVLVEPPAVVENLRVDVDVRVERDMWIRSTEANIEVFTPPEIGPLNVRIEGIGRDLALEGTINTDRGEYAFMGRRFDLARGSVTFGPERELDPLIRLTAEHEVQMPAREAFDIRIILDGTLTELETELESTAQPPLSQTDLLSFVVFGRDAGSLLQQQGSALTGQGTAGGPLVGAVAARAAQQFATVGFQAVVTEVETETARALGLDVLHIQPADLPAEISTGEFIDVLRGTEIEAGTYLTPRLFVSGQARPTFVHPGALVEYQTEHGWVWRATWRPRYLPAVPTLSRTEPDRASVLGSLLFREWRF